MSLEKQYEIDKAETVLKQLKTELKVLREKEKEQDVQRFKDKWHLSPFQVMEKYKRIVYICSYQGGTEYVPRGDEQHHHWISRMG